MGKSKRRKRDSSTYTESEGSVMSRDLVKRIAHLEHKLKQVQTCSMQRQLFRSRCIASEGTKGDERNVSIGSNGLMTRPGNYNIRREEHLGEGVISLGYFDACSIPEAPKDANASRDLKQNSAEDPLPQVILKMLGEEPDESNENTFSLHDALVSTWRDHLINGMPREECINLLNKYSIPANLPYVVPPKLNPEITKLLISDKKSLKRDESYVEVQNRLGKGISALGQGITTILNNTDDISNNLKDCTLPTLFDSARILTGLFHRISVTRRNCVFPLLNSSMKEVVERCPVGEFLFDSDLGGKIKLGRNIESASKSLRSFGYPYRISERRTCGYLRGEPSEPRSRQLKRDSSQADFRHDHLPTSRNDNNKKQY